jgi:DNA-binding transcriptional LysR family regulator
MEIRYLRYFVMVADELNFSRAAKKLNMAQPPLSQQIQSLEKKLDVILFDRKMRPLQLTSAGQAFLEECRSILANYDQNLDQAIHRTQRIHRGELGCLTIGFTSSIANSILPNILRTFRQEYPEIKLILREDNSAFQIERLRDHQTDVVFVYQNHDLTIAKDLKMTTLSEEMLVVVLPQNHPLAVQSQISLTDLANEEFIMPRTLVVSDLPEQIADLCKEAGFTPKVVQEATFMVTILGLVAGEVGISILPSSVENLQRKGVVYRPIQEKTAVNQLIVVWRDADSSTILKQFLKIAKTVSMSKKP